VACAVLQNICPTTGGVTEVVEDIGLPPPCPVRGDQSAWCDKLAEKLSGAGLFVVFLPKMIMFILQGNVEQSLKRLYLIMHLSE